LTTERARGLWDCNVFVGRRAGRRYAPAYDVDAARLITEMDRLGVAGAMTYHVLAHELAPALGNERLVVEVAGEPRLEPVWVVLPQHTGELPPGDRLVEEMTRHGVRMARMFPSAELSGHRFSLADWCAGTLLGALAEQRIPLILDFTLFRRGEPPWETVWDVCRRHARLPVLLIGVQGRNNRTLYALLAELPNLLIETSGLNVHRGIEDVCRRFGPQRLVFGSGYPVQSMGGAVFQLQRAELDEDDRGLVASGTLRQLLDPIGGGVPDAT
jgi:hypothetical protein